MHNKDFENIEKAIQKLKQQEEKLVELYLSSSLDVETINRKNISLAELQSNYKDKENTIKNNEAILNNTVDIELDNILKSYYELNGGFCLTYEC